MRLLFRYHACYRCNRLVPRGTEGQCWVFERLLDCDLESLSSATRQAMRRYALNPHREISFLKRGNTT